MPAAPVTPTFFKHAAKFRAWLERHHATKTELWVGYYKKASGKGGMVYPEALDQALCFGWIDGQVKSIDADCYMQRFSPRRKGSSWSIVNIDKARRLIVAGLMAAPGLVAFEARSVTPPMRYSHEGPVATFDRQMLRQFKADAKAWRWWEEQPPAFRKAAIYWVTTAKKAETRASRMATLIDCAGRGVRPRPFIVPAGARRTEV